MSERRRIRLAAIPYRDDEIEPPKKVQTKKFRVKVTTSGSGESQRKPLSPSRNRKIKEGHRRQNLGIEKNNILETLEASWALVENGKKMFEDSFDGGKIQAMVKANLMPQHKQRNQQQYENKERIQNKIRSSLRCDQRAQARRLSDLGFDSFHSSASRNSILAGSIESTVSEDSVSSGESMLSAGSKSQGSSSSYSDSTASASPRRRRNLAVDGSYTFDSFESNSILADNSSFETSGSSTIPSEASTNDSVETDEAGISTLWDVFKAIVVGTPKTRNSHVMKRKKKQESDSMAEFTGKMEVLLEVDSSESWIDSIKTNSNESFADALNKELGYYREMEEKMSASSFSLIQETQSHGNVMHERKRTADLSDAEFLQVIRQAANDSTTQAREISSPSKTPELSNTDFMKALRQYGADDVDTSNHRNEADMDDHLEDGQTNIYQSDQVGATTSFHKEDEKITDLESIHVNVVSPSRQDMGEKTKETEYGESQPLKKTIAETSLPPTSVELSDNLSNAEFLEAMRESLKVEGGQFVDERQPEAELITDDSTEDIREERVDDRDDATATELSNYDFLKAMRQTTVGDSDCMNEMHEDINEEAQTQFLGALWHMGEGGSHEFGEFTMFGVQTRLETIQEVDSCFSHSTSESRSRSMSSNTSQSAGLEDGDDIIKEQQEDNQESTQGISDSASNSIVEDEQNCSSRHTVAESHIVSQVSAQKGEAVVVVNDSEKHQDKVQCIPDLKCISSDESDTQFDPQPSDLAVRVEDGETKSFLSAVEGDTDTHFLSAIESPEELGIEGVGSSSDSLDAILDDARTKEEEEGYVQRSDIAHEERITTVKIATDESVDTSEGHGVKHTGALRGLIGFWEKSSSSSQDSGDDNSVSPPSNEGEAQIEAESNSNESVMTVKRTGGAMNTSTMPHSTSSAEVEDVSTHEAVLPLKNIHDSSNGSEINKQIGQKVLQGWTVLASTCPKCVLPLLANATAKEASCISCNYSKPIVESGNGISTMTALAPPAPPPIASKKSHGGKKKRKAAISPVSKIARTAPVMASTRQAVSE